MENQQNTRNLLGFTFQKFWALVFSTFVSFYGRFIFPAHFDILRGKSARDRPNWLPYATRRLTAMFRHVGKFLNE